MKDNNINDFEINMKGFPKAYLIALIIYFTLVFIENNFFTPQLEWMGKIISSCDLYQHFYTRKNETIQITPLSNNINLE